MKAQNLPPVNDLLDTNSLRERYDDATEAPHERTVGNVMLVLLGVALVLALVLALPASSADCPPSAAASYLEAQGYTQVELEPQNDGWWRSWWLAPDGSVRFAVLQPLGDGSGCHAWHMAPAEAASIEKLRLASEKSHR